MSNFKSGSGNLDFGDDDESTEPETADEASPRPVRKNQRSQNRIERLLSQLKNQLTSQQPTLQLISIHTLSGGATLVTNAILASKSMSVTR